jgi:hypothetical protein
LTADYEGPAVVYVAAVTSPNRPAFYESAEMPERLIFSVVAAFCFLDLGQILPYHSLPSLNRVNGVLLPSRGNMLILQFYGSRALLKNNLS